MSSRRDFIKATAVGTAGLMLSNNYLYSSPAGVPYANDSTSLRFRQIHLDFHTSEKIAGVGSDFDPEKFADTLKKASVNSVTCFGRCHHGYIYHDTKMFPERHHPSLKRNLLKEQIEACHKKNIRVPVYVTMQWDLFSANRHPEWLMRDEKGQPLSTNGTFEPGFYQHLCILTPYREFLKKYVTELFEQVPVDGLFFDIFHALPNANQESINGILKKGLDPAISEVRQAFYKQALDGFKAEMTAFVRKLDKNCTIFYNGGHVGPYIRSSINSYTHLELESLPSGGWGYLHFPLTSRYARNLGKDIMGMTGKFHTSWGDFHSLKNQPALEFECFTMLAQNAKCSIGDQLHPQGILDPGTYDLIGAVYKQVAEKEPWCVGAKALSDIAVFSPEKETGTDNRINDVILGAVRILQEGKHQFDVVDRMSDWSSYKVLVFPDVIAFNDQLKSKVEAFVARGGAVIASYQSGLTEDKKAFASPVFGLELVGEAPFSPDFLVPEGEIGKGLPKQDFVMYTKGMQVKPLDAKVLVNADIPYFNRTWEHFVSHKHTPSAFKAGYPGITKAGKVIYFMHPVFTQYAQNTPLWCKKLVLNALDILLPMPVLKVDAPSFVVASYNEQALLKRRVIHLLNYIPERRGTQFDVIEDIISTENVTVSASAGKTISKVTIVPQGKVLEFKQENGRIVFIVPEIKGHQMIELA